MPVVLTSYNADIVLGVYPEQLYQVLPEVFQQMLQPDLDAFALYHYCKAIHDRLDHDEELLDGQLGFDEFGAACFEVGIVKTFLQIAKDPRTDRWPALAAHFALHAMLLLMKTGTVDERKELLKEMLDHDVVDFCLEKIQSGAIAIHRQGAVSIFRCLAYESFLGEFITAAQTAKIVTRMCEFILAGPQFYIDQLGDPSLTWQSFLSFGSFGAPTEKAAKYAPRSYAMSQENAAWTIQGLFLRCPPPDHRFCYEVLKQDASMIDLLFKAAASPRPPCYAELAVDAIICEAIAMIFRVPELGIPGVDVKVEVDDVQDERDNDWEALLDCLRLLLSRPKWVDFLLGIWTMIEDEKLQEVRRMLKESQSKYYAQSRYSLETYLQIFEFRGSCRICVERLIATATYAATKDNFSKDDILSLLRITNAAIRPLPKGLKQAVTSTSEDDRNFYLENDFELYRKPLYTVFTEDDVEPPLQVANEPNMGPTAHARLLTLLAENNHLTNISKLPKAISSSRMALAQLKQICTPDSIRKFLTLAKQRITLRREVGHKRFREEEEMDYACFAYFTAAELAASLVAFDLATKGLYKKEIAGVRREQVLCLGNAAEMALGQELYERALYYATAAVHCAESLPRDNSPDGVDMSIREKNRRRVARAKEGLAL